MYRENYKAASGAQIAIACGGCLVGGGAVAALGFLGAFGDYASLEKMGFSISTILCYVFVILCGLGILVRVPYAVSAALVACAVEFALYIGLGVMGTSSIDMSFFIMLKLAVAICCMQLLVTIKTDDAYDEAPKNVHYVLPEGAPQARQKQVYQETPGNFDQAAANQGCSVARNARGIQAGVPQPRRCAAQAPSAPVRQRNR